MDETERSVQLLLLEAEARLLAEGTSELVAQAVAEYTVGIISAAVMQRALDLEAESWADYGYLRRLNLMRGLSL